ncbi:dihydroorotate dehydrogenase electron transfer subunit [Salipaludibacillus neizhouensis]|uniref:Dihydroorotate dehydrogenase B (NAD(+)), electron transfer subunit n=1 Tax=Salipaludibacillus neizhouensis TaxID=885475 RepID=A0A3A9KM33_9BACI|nr:dihydroorotate dehydrogenase electron transfer subunit [Salipaludibacillus neizhouensis]RKL68935.1 dihydroorotate dehydrogenase electron transfer subunit [Salipaludibacillus neizhouensis]
MIVDKLEIVKQEELAPKIFEMTLTGNSVNEMVTPGQFLHVKVADGIDPLLRRPISICNVDIDQKKLSIIYRVEGKGTKRLSERIPGEKVDILGPLGQGFPIDQLIQGNTALLVGGGVGIPPLYYLAKLLVAKGIKVKTIIGFRTEKDIFLEKKFAKLSDVTITTEDGSRGTKGFVTTAMEEQKNSYDVFYTCGPTPMLRAVQLAATSTGYVSLEERMGCGIGACLACVCDVNEPAEGEKKYRKICCDGPVFEAGEVVI